MTRLQPRYLDAGEAALVVEFGSEVDPAVHDKVLGLDAALAATPLAGVSETVPTYRSLMIHYDPLVLDRAALVADVAARLDALPDRPVKPARIWSVPICYDAPHGEDIGNIAAQTGLSPEKVVALHRDAAFRVYMYGFAPGFCYLGGCPPELAISRRMTPRPPHPPNAVMIAGGLGVISTVSMPTGWWIVGRTPERMFSATREPHVVFGVGDELRFESVDADTFAALDARGAAGEIVSRARPGA